MKKIIILLVILQSLIIFGGTKKIGFGEQNYKREIGFEKQKIKEEVIACPGVRSRIEIFLILFSNYSSKFVKFSILFFPLNILFTFPFKVFLSETSYRR